jgi:hypothetical protein
MPRSCSSIELGQVGNQESTSEIQLIAVEETLVLAVPFAAVEVCVQEGQPLPERGFRCQCQHGHAGLYRWVEVGLWSTPVGAAESVDTVVRNRDRNDRHIAEQGG